MSSPTIPSEALVMMTLSGLAAASGPADQSASLQQDTILDNLGAQLRNPNLATKAQWMPIWVGLSDDLANLVYVAKYGDTRANVYAVVIRGTVFSLPMDISEDVEVSTTAPFLPRSAPEMCDDPIVVVCDDSSALCISQGAKQAFCEVIQPRGRLKLTLVEFLRSIAESAPRRLKIYVCGHSLGGATTTTLALYLKDGVDWPETPVFQVYTFAAPTAGTQGFAGTFASTFGGDKAGSDSAWQIANAYDVIPTLWVKPSMSAVKSWYPTPGPVATAEVKGILDDAMQAPGSHVYVQPSSSPGVTPITLNQDYSTLDRTHTDKTEADFMAQVGFQHANNTYLKLIADSIGVSPPPWISPCPGSPSGVKAMPTGPTTITISWTPPAPDPASGPLGSPSGAPTSYAVMRSTTSSGPPYTRVAVVSAKVTSYADSGLAAGTMYYYVVQAVNDSGWSPVSSQANASTS